MIGFFLPHWWGLQVGPRSFKGWREKPLKPSSMGREIVRKVLLLGKKADPMISNRIFLGLFYTTLLHGYGSKLGTPKLWIVNTKLD